MSSLHYSYCSVGLKFFQNRVKNLQDLNQFEGMRYSFPVNWSWLIKNQLFKVPVKNLSRMCYPEDHAAPHTNDIRISKGKAQT